MRWWLVAPDGTLTKCSSRDVDRLLKRRRPDGTWKWRYAYQEKRPEGIGLFQMDNRELPEYRPPQT